jgi:hypothetical protein
MDSGAKFLFTNLPPEEFEMPPEVQAELYEKFEDTGIMRSNIFFEEGILGSMFCRDIGMNVGEIEVSRAVTASAAVPLVFGPVIMKDELHSTPEISKYIHLNDGGVGDTLGLETIMELALNRFSQEDCPYKKGMIIIIDANQSIDPTDTEEIIRAFGVGGGVVERTRVVYAYRGKSLAYYAIMFLQCESRFNDISFVLISPYLVRDEELLKAIAESPYPESSLPPELADIIDKFKATPTRLKIDPEKANSLEKAADLVVKQVKDLILENYLEGCGMDGDDLR